MCWEEVGETTCRLCGRLVCREHVRGGVCEACRTCLCELCGTSLSTGYCTVCGRLVCEKCSVELGVARVCVDCYAKETS
ncbi:MAG TPA: hypothetical protein ENG30_03910 [Thermofilaceae archaeon]|nr:hypothetical protein [Thermofilaceae archaeon]